MWKKLDFFQKLHIFSNLIYTFRYHYLTNSYEAAYSIFDGLKSASFVNIERLENGSVFYSNPGNKTALYMGFIVYKCGYLKF